MSPVTLHSETGHKDIGLAIKSCGSGKEIVFQVYRRKISEMCVSRGHSMLSK
jgi:hypothetical protein